MGKKRLYFKKILLPALVMAVFVVAYVVHEAQAADGIRKVINFQGKVVNSNGTNVTDGTYDFVVKIYDGASSGASTLFTESWTAAALWSSTMSAAPGNGGESLTYSTESNESTLKVGQILTNTTKGESVVITSVDTGANTVGISPTRQAWAGADTVTNKLYVKDGVFRVAINALNQDLSGVNFNTDSLFVGINFNSDGEMKPRIQYLATPYAFNAEKVNGLNVTNTSDAPFSTATTLKIADGKTFIVNNGLEFTGTDGKEFTFPNLSGASDTVVTEAFAQTLTNKTIGSTGLVFDGATTDITTGTDEHFVIMPNGSGNVGIGLTAPDAKLHVYGAVTGKALAIFDEDGDQDIFTASASGVAKFSLTRDGGIKLGADEGENLECLLSGGAGAAATWGSCGGGSTAWSGLQAPSDNLSLNHSTHTTTFDFANTTTTAYSMNFDSLTSGIGLALSTDGSAHTSGTLIDLSYITTSATGNIPGRKAMNIVIDNSGNVDSGLDVTGGQFIDVTRTGASGGTIEAVGQRITTRLTPGGISINYGSFIESTGGDSVYGIQSAGQSAPNTETSAMVVGGKFVALHQADSVLGSAMGLTAGVQNVSSNQISDAYGIRISQTSNSGGIVNHNYGLYIEDQSSVGSTSSYNLYSAGATAKNYFAGKVGIGSLTPDGKLQVTGAVTGKALGIFDETGDQDIFTASASGVAKFSLTRAGGIKLGTDQGDNLECLLSGGAGAAATWGSCGGGTNYWQLASNVLAPGGGASVTDRLVLGGNTTTDFQFEVNGKITGKALVSLNETGDQAILTASASGTSVFTIGNDGHLAIGTGASVNQNIESNSADILNNTRQTVTGFSKDYVVGNYLELTLNPSANVFSGVKGQYIKVSSSGVTQDFFSPVYGQQVTYQHGQGSVGEINGSRISAQVIDLNSGESVTNLYGIYGETRLGGNHASATIANSYAGYFNSSVQGIVTATNTYGLYTQVTKSAGAIGSGYGLYIASATNSNAANTFTNNYGLYINDQSGVGNTLSYNFYSAGAAAKNYFAGKVGIGSLTPDGNLQVEGASKGKALAILNETGDQNILSASSSGSQVFQIGRIPSAGNSGDFLSLNPTLTAMDGAGSDVVRGLTINFTNADHTGGTLKGIEIGNITGDAQAAETGLSIGTGWDKGLVIEGASGTYSVQLSSDAHTVASGITFGTASPITLYKSANGQVTIGDGTNGLVLDAATGPSYTGTMRPTKTITLSPEYAGGTLTAFYGTGTDSSTTGTMTADVETTGANKLRTYYEWTSSEASAQYYTIAVRVTLPKDFDAWDTGGITVDFLGSVDDPIATLDIRVYEENDSTMASTDAESLANTGDFWVASTISAASLDEWNAAGETGVIYLRMGAAQGDWIKVGDIKLHYKAKF